MEFCAQQSTKKPKESGKVNEEERNNIGTFPKGLSYKA